MTLRVFTHSRSKRAEAIALLDSGATENFMSLPYAKYLHLPIKTLAEPRRLFNVDRTQNRAGDLKYYVDMKTRTGTRQTNLRYFLTDLGDHKIILGYPWFATAQLKIDWAQGWIDHSQLPIVLRAADAAMAQFAARTTRLPRMKIRRGKIEPIDKRIPPQYRWYAKVFSDEESKRFPLERPWDHAIDLKDGAPSMLISRNIRLSQVEQEELKAFLKEHLSRGTIRLSKSPYATAFFFIKKKNGKLRPVQDYCPVNTWTIRNKYPLPLIPQLTDRLRGCTLFTKFDIQWGYNVVRIKKGHEWKAAFTTNDGLYEPTVMFFGLCNSLATFQAMMNTLFCNLIASGDLTVYMDNMAMHTSQREGEMHEEHLARHRKIVNEVLAILEQNSLFLNIDKCEFEQPHIDFLGVRVENNQMKMEDTKIDRVRDWAPPWNLREVQRFLGFTGYYRYFIQGYSAIARPLLLLTKQATPWHWEEPQQQAFNTLKARMCTKPILQQPDFKKVFYLQTDTSAYGVGAVLSQEGGTMMSNSPNAKPR